MTTLHLIKRLLGFSALVSTFILAYASQIMAERLHAGHRFSDVGVVEVVLNDNPLSRDMGGQVQAPALVESLKSGRVFTLHSIELLPGLEYNLGLLVPDHPAGMKVVLYDRFPLLPGARRVDLPMSPVVKTGRKKLEYRWRVGISIKSTSPLLYVLVGFDGMLNRPVPYTVFISTPPDVPSDLPGRGVTYLEGPRDFLLSCDQPRVVAYAIEKPRPAIDPASLTLAIIGDLVNNGWFRNGLNHWEPHRDYRPAADVKTVALLDEGLRISSESTSEREGVMQLIDADVSDADSLILRADVKVDRQVLGGTGPDGRTAPAAIAVCYEDVQGGEHCKSDILWTGFYSLDPVKEIEEKSGIRAPQGLWYRYITDLMQLEPRPRKVRFISLEGSGIPGREAWIRDVHLVKRKKGDYESAPEVPQAPGR